MLVMRDGYTTNDDTEVSATKEIFLAYMVMFCRTNAYSNQDRNGPLTIRDLNGGQQKSLSLIARRTSNSQISRQVLQRGLPVRQEIIDISEAVLS